MAIKEILDRIKTKLPADAGEEINALLADARREADTILDDLKSANSESKSRKDKLRELQSEIETLKTEADTLKSKQNTDEFKALQKKASDYDALIEKQNTELVKTWQEKQKLFEVKETDPRKAKIDAIRGDFQFLEGEQLTPDIARANLDRLSLVEKTGVFEVQKQNGTDYKHGTDPNNQPAGFKFFQEK